MNYREWLLYRAQQHQTPANEPEVLRYTTWQNRKAVREWMRRSDAVDLFKNTLRQPFTSQRLT